MTRRLSLLLVLMAAAGCRCEEPLPVFPTRPADGSVSLVEAAQPEGGARATTATSDLSVPPRDGDLGWWVDIDLDGDQRPHLAYTDAFNGELHYAVWTGTGWEVTAVDTYGAVGKYPSIAVDARGRPHIIYYNQDKKRLHYTTLVGRDSQPDDDRRRPFKAHPDWLFEVIDDGPEVGMASDLALDPDGALHAVYYANDERLHHATRPSTPRGEHARWTVREVDGSAGGSHSIVIGQARAADGTRHLAYAHWTVFDSELRYARLGPDDETWEVTPLTKKGNAGWKAGLFLDDDERPAIIYLALLDRRLLIARPDADGKRWTHAPLVDSANTLAVAWSPRGPVTLAYEHLPGVGLAGAQVRVLRRPDTSGDLAAGWELVELGRKGGMSTYLAAVNTPSGEPMLAWYDGDVRGVKVYFETSLTTTPLPPLEPAPRAAPEKP